MPHVETLTVGPLQSNCHICHDADGNAVIIDPGAEEDRILAYVKDKDLNVEAIWLTHAHFDHIGALAAVKEATGAPVLIHEAEKDWPGNNLLNGAELFGIPARGCPPDRLWKGGETELGAGTYWKVMHVPGHSPGSVALVSEKDELAFSGDLVFCGSVGRVDLPGGNPQHMMESLFEFMKLPESIRIYVGHGPSTLIGVERVTNFVIRDILGDEGLPRP